MVESSSDQLRQVDELLERVETILSAGIALVRELQQTDVRQLSQLVSDVAVLVDLVADRPAVSRRPTVVS